MKKLLAVAMAAMTLVSASFAKTIVLDMAESAQGPVAQIEKNQYADNYQCTSLTQADFSKQLKGGLPEVGDIVQIHYKFTSDVDLDTVDFYLVDTSAAASYWTLLFAEDNKVSVPGVVKGQVYEGVAEFEVTTAAKSKVMCVIQYDQLQKSKITFQKTGVQTTKVEVAKRKPKTWKIDLGKYAAMIAFTGNYPWIDGKQDRSTLLGYRAELCINQAFGKELPIVGDTIIVNFKGQSNYDIKNAKILLYEHAECVGWWAELCPEDQQFQDWVSDVKAGVPFKTSVKFNVVREPQEDVSLCIDYTLDDCNGSSIIKMVK